jgi:hypothetical protein
MMNDHCDPSSVGLGRKPFLFFSLGFPFTSQYHMPMKCNFFNSVLGLFAKRASNKQKARKNHCKKGIKQTQGYGKPLQKGCQTNTRLGKTIAKRASNKQKARENHCKKGIKQTKG